MTTFLGNTAQAKDVAKITLVTQSAENLVHCLNSLLKAGADMASKDDGSDIQEKVNICHLVLYCIILIKRTRLLNVKDMFRQLLCHRQFTDGITMWSNI